MDRETGAVSGVQTGRVCLPCQRLLCREGEEREDIRERSDRKREDRGRHPEKRVSAYREENHNRPRSMWSSLQTVQLG